MNLSFGNSKCGQILAQHLSSSPRKMSKARGVYALNCALAKQLTNISPDLRGHYAQMLTSARISQMHNDLSLRGDKEVIDRLSALLKVSVREALSTNYATHFQDHHW